MIRQLSKTAVLGIALLAAPASATIWTYSGLIDNCNVAICSLVPIEDGFPVVGTIEIDVGVNDSFTLATAGDGSGGFLDLIDFDFLVGGVIPVLPVVCPDPPAVCDPVTGLPDGTGVLLSGSGTTDADGNFSSGVVNGSFVGATLGPLLGEVTIDLVAGTMSVTVGSGTVFVADVVANPGFEQLADSDSDGVTDDADNCTDAANPGQEDADGDGHGNLCDADFNNSCGPVNFADLAIMQGGFFTLDPLLDLNSSGGPVNFADLAIMQGLFFLQPGPSAPGALCN